MVMAVSLLPRHQAGKLLHDELVAQLPKVPALLAVACLIGLSSRLLARRRGRATSDVNRPH